MALRKLTTLLLLALLTTGLQAAQRNPRKQKAKAQAVAPDTLSLDQFSYAIGVAHTQGLLPYLEQQMGIPQAYLQPFIEGLSSGTLTDEELRWKARIAGKEMRQQLTTRGLEAVNLQIGDTAVHINDSLFFKGFIDALANRTPLTLDSAHRATTRQLDYYRRQRAERDYGDNRRAGEEFLKANAKAKGVTVTKSGLQYKVLTQGNGPVPTATQRVKVNYEGRLVDGTIFDSSYQRNQPATFAANQVIKGWAEALTMMPVGSKWELYIPQELGYGDRQSGKIPPLSALIFTVELLSIE